MTDVDDVKAASDLSSDLEQIVQWGKDWFVTFNASKTKLVTFHHKWKVLTLKKSRVLKDFLVGLKLTPNLKWNSWIRFV